jgi:hypothetical protein
MRSPIHLAHGAARAAGVAFALAMSLSLVGASSFAQGVVTLETPAPPGSESTAGPDSQAPVDPQEAMLAYVECMREHGIDMPDPEFTSDGGVIMRSVGGEDDGPGLSGGPGDTRWAEAHGDCEHFFGAQVGEIDPEEVARSQEQALAFARCMREHGVDMPDPQFTADGGISIMIGGPDGGPMDADVFQEAQTACGGGFGIGIGPDGPPDGPDGGVPPGDGDGSLPDGTETLP